MANDLSDAVNLTAKYNLDFSGEEIIIPVPIRGKNYLLKEIDGDDALAYKNEVARCAKFNAEGKMTQTVGLPATQSFLVSKCLFESDGITRVDIKDIRKMPQKAVQGMFLTILRVNHMAGEETLEDLKRERTEIDERIRELEEAAEKLGNE